MTRTLSPALGSLTRRALASRGAIAAGWRIGGFFLVRVAGTALNFLALLVLARLLGAEDYGLYVYWTAVAGLLGIVASLGMPQIVTREAAAARGRGDPAALRAVVRLALAVTAATGLVLVTVGLAIAARDPAGDGLARLVTAPPMVAMTAMALLTVGSVMSALQLGFERPVASLLPIGIVQPALLASLALAMALLAERSADARDALLLYLASATAALALAMILLRGALRGGAALKPNAAAAIRPDRRAWLMAGILLMGSQLLTNAATQVDILMLGWLATPEAVGIYHAMARLIFVATFWYGVMCAVLQPTLSRLWAAGDRVALQRTLAETYVPSFLVTLAGLAGLVVVGRLLLGLFGPDFTAGYPALVLHGILWAAGIACGPGLTMVYAIGGEREALLAMLAGMAVTVLLNLVLIPPYGIMGAAMAFSGVAVVTPLLLAVLCARRFGVRCDLLGCLKALRRAEPTAERTPT